MNFLTKVSLVKILDLSAVVIANANVNSESKTVEIDAIDLVNYLNGCGIEVEEAPEPDDTETNSDEV